MAFSGVVASLPSPGVGEGELPSAARTTLLRIAGDDERPRAADLS